MTLEELQDLWGLEWIDYYEEFLEFSLESGSRPHMQ